jgi:hypothetical protein
MSIILYPFTLDRWIVYFVDVDRLEIEEIREGTPAKVLSWFVVE